MISRFPEVSLPDLIGTKGIFIDGDWVESKDQDKDGDVRLIQLADVGEGGFLDKSNRFMTSAKAKALKCTFLLPGDILVARMPDPIGRACIFPGDNKLCVTVVDVCIIRPDSSLVDSRWLVHRINSPEFKTDISSWVTGTTRQRISRGNLSKLKFRLPPLDEQRRIAAILDKADAIRRKRQESIRLTEEFLRSTFLEMFGDPVTNPKGWDRKPIKYFCSDIVDCPHSTPTYSDVITEYPCIRSSDLQDGKIISSETKYVNESIYEERIKRLRPEPGDIIFCREGARLGNSGLILNGMTPCLGQRTMLFRMSDNISTPEYFISVINTEHVKQFFAEKTIGAAAPRINVGELLEIEILCPPHELQRKFSTVFKKAFSLLSKSFISNSNLDQVFSSLTHRAFRGEL